MERHELESRALSRLLASVVKDDQGCWNWTRYLDPSGYGRMRFGGSPTAAHRVAYELFVGPIPSGYHVDHLCRNRACVNPDHLEPVTPAENGKRGIGPTAINARKVRCPQGHLYDEVNTYVAPTTSKRNCRACNREAVRKMRARQAGVNQTTETKGALP